MSNQSDVIVIGAGFAGLVAARELRHKNKSVTVLEARDRLGGRVWTDDRLGFSLEMGGTWVHWSQPHLWAEMTRYDVDIVQSPEPVSIAWLDGDDLAWFEPDDFWRLLDDGQQRFQADVRDIYPRPFDPLFNSEGVSSLDDRSVTDRLQQLGLSSSDYALNYTLWSLHFHAPCEEGALTQALRWAALGGWDWQSLLDACITYKLVGGMSGLIGRIAADSAADIHLSTPVTAVEQTADGVRVRVESGNEFTAGVVIVTVPVNVLADVTFNPPLGSKKRALAQEGQATRGFKVWIRIRGKLDPILALAAPPHAINVIQAEYWSDDATVVVGFGIDAEKLDISDVDAVQAEIRKWLPDAEVEACSGHDWQTDPYSKGTWGMFRPGQLSKYVEDARQPEGRVVLAGSGLGNGWANFVDGAIESGIHAARVAESAALNAASSAGASGGSTLPLD